MTDDPMLRAALAGMHQAPQVHVAAPLNDTQLLISVAGAIYAARSRLRHWSASPTGPEEAAPRQALMQTCAEEALGLLQVCVALTRPRPEGA